MEQKFYKTYKINSLKFWQNFWEYYKLHIIAILFVVILAVIGIRSCVNRVDTDLKIIYVGENGILSPNNFREFMEMNTEDIDGDGKVFVDFSNESVSAKKDIEGAVVILNKIDADLMSGDPFILMTDETFIARFVNMGALLPIEDILEGKDVPEDCIMRDARTGSAVAVDVSGMPFSAEVGAYPGTKVYVGMKVLPKNKADDEKYLALHNQAKEIIEKMIEYK